MTVTPTPGADITCTFTNTQSGSITIQKTSLGGDATFGITEPTLGNRNVTTTNGSGSVTYTGVAPGSYDFDESPLAGWVAGDFGGACAADGTVTFAAGQTLTCTLTNTRLGSITIQKSAVGGDANVRDHRTDAGEPGRHDDERIGVGDLHRCRAPAPTTSTSHRWLAGWRVISAERAPRMGR